MKSKSSHNDEVMAGRNDAIFSYLHFRDPQTSLSLESSEAVFRSWSDSMLLSGRFVVTKI